MNTYEQQSAKWFLELATQEYAGNTKSLKINIYCNEEVEQ